MQCLAVCCSVLQCLVSWVGLWHLLLIAITHIQADVTVLQCVAVCCSVLQRVAACCSVLQCAAVCFNMLQCVAVSCRWGRILTPLTLLTPSHVLQCRVAVSVLQCLVDGVGFPHLS